MNILNNLLVELGVGIRAKTRTFKTGVSGGPTSIVVKISLELTDCFSLLGPIVLGGTFFGEYEPCTISVEQSLLLFD